MPTSGYQDSAYNSRRRFLQATAAGGIGALAGCIGGQQNNSELTTVQIGETPSSGALSSEALVASKKGFDEEFGVKFKRQQYGLGIHIMEDLAAQKLHIASDGASWAFLVTASQGDVGLLSHNYSWLGGVGFVTQNDIKDGSDLKGKKIATVKGSIWDFMLSRVLQQFDLSTDDVNIVGMNSGSDMLAALNGGSVDAAWLWLQFLSKAKNMDGIKMFAEGFELAPKTMESWGVFTAQRTWAEENTDVVADALKAIQKAIEWEEQNKLEASELISNNYEVPQKAALDTLGNIDLFMGLQSKYINHYQSMMDFGRERDSFPGFDMKTGVVEEPITQAFPDKVDWEP